ncbi:4Fe-4S binding protein [Roseburia hominis]
MEDGRVQILCYRCRCKGEGIYITEACMGCGACTAVCPQRCIEEGVPYRIYGNHCLHCGNGCENCPSHAIERK